jgi:glycosyltransferase involved in cell wall biosynthesis
MTSAPETGWTVGYLTKRFPRLSETFILDEIIGLEAAGVALQLYAIADPAEAVTQPDVARVVSPVVYLRGTGRRGIPRGVATTVAAHARLVAADPSHYLAALRAARHERARTGTIRPFLDAGRLAVKLRRVHARHLHAAFAHGPASTARFVHLLTGLPFSFAAHAKDLYLSDPADLAAKAAAAEFVLVCSAAAAAALAERAGPAANIVLAYHGVDTDRFHPAPTPPQRRPPTDELRVLAVGRLVPKKGYPVLLEALGTLVAAGRPVRCEIVGGGPDRAELCRQIDHFGLGEVVTLTGSCTHQQVADAYRRADVFAQASVVLADGDRDGIPNSLLEAMASGLAVVASAVSGIPEAVDDGITGLLVPPDDPGALAAALADLGENNDLRARLGSAARARVVADFDRRVCAERVAARFDPSLTTRVPMPSPGRG